MSHVSISQWIENFQAGKYASPDIQTQVDAGWFDWFCRDKSLRNKTYALAPKIKRISKSPKINIDTMYVLFKNNSPMVGSLYDDFRFCDLESKNVVYTIIPSSGQASVRGLASVWGRENSFKEPIIDGTWKDICDWFGV